MRASSEFLLGLLGREDPACVSAEDWEGVHGPTLRLWQGMGFVDRVPAMNPVPSCPHCGEGVPYRCGRRLLCDRCRSEVDVRHLHLWCLRLPAFLDWVAAQWGLRGGVSRIDAQLWQLGASKLGGSVHECFFRRGASLSEAASDRLASYRQALVLTGPTGPAADATGRAHLCLLELLDPGPPLALADPAPFLRPRGRVRFDAGSGVLWAGDGWFGEVPVGSKEFYLLDGLARDLDRFVPYRDLKAYVLRAAGSADSTEEATFCQRLKNRIKRTWVPGIDRLIATTNKGEGYRLRGYVEA